MQNPEQIDPQAFANAVFTMFPKEAEIVRLRLVNQNYQQAFAHAQQHEAEGETVDGPLAPVTADDADEDAA